MNASLNTVGSIPGNPDSSAPLNPQTALLEAFFPGFSLLSSALYKYAKIDISLYIPASLAIAGILFAFKYVNQYLWDLLETHWMSTADIRVDDESTYTPAFPTLHSFLSLRRNLHTTNMPCTF